MSNMVPRETIDALRQYVDVAMANYGIDCTLYIPTTTSLNDSETFDAYATPSDLTYTSYSAKVFIEWNPNIHRLRKIGIFAEKETPMLAWFGRKATNQSNEEVDVDIVQQSYFSIEIEYVPDNIEGTNEFEIVDLIPGKVHDAVIKKGFIIAPRRVDV